MGEAPNQGALVNMAQGAMACANLWLIGGDMMSRKANFLVTVFSCVLVVACGDSPGGGSGGATPSGGFSVEALEQAITDMPMKLDMGRPEPVGCPPPKPQNVGCTTICKPCKFWVCVEGEWKAENLTWPSGTCDGPNVDFGDDPSACPRRLDGFCPAECSICI